MYKFILTIFLVVILLIIVFGIATYFVITQLRHRLRKSETEAIEAIIAAQERERALISREVHDNLGPMLSITNMQIGFLAEQTGPADQKELLFKMKNQVQTAIDQCRNIAHMISPSVGSSKTFQNVLEEQIAYISEFGNITIRHTIPSDLPLIDPIKGTSLIRVFQELLVNTIRHAEATEITIQIEKTQDHLFLTYQDNGKGFQLKSVTMGLGIQNIRKRIEIIDGKQLWNKSAGISGMNLQIMVPIQKLAYEHTHR